MAPNNAEADEAGLRMAPRSLALCSADSVDSRGSHAISIRAERIKNRRAIARESGLKVA
jgi:hypothetical protein